MEKPWGYELHWAKTDRYVGKLIHVNAGHALSLQYHNQKDETIFLWSGRHAVRDREGHEGTAGGPLTKREMKPGEAVHVTPKTVHRMTAITDCDIFEVSTPELQDVVRLEDRYGRTPVGPGGTHIPHTAMALTRRNCVGRGCRVGIDVNGRRQRRPLERTTWEA